MMKAPLHFSRRRFCGAGLATLGLSQASHVLAGTATANAEMAIAGPSLKEQAAKAGITFGAAVGMSQLANPLNVRILQHDVACVAPDVELCPNRVMDTSGKYSFTKADNIVNKLQSLGFQIYGHHILWNDYVPAFVKGLPVAEVPAFMDNHVKTMVSHFHGKLIAWNVVNEPCFYWRPNTNGLREGPYLSAMGEGYVARAFKLAKTIDPLTPMVLNEAFTERSDVGGFIRTRLLALIDSIQAAGGRIDAIGLQGHLRPQFGVDYAGYEKFLSQLERRNLDIFITELDVEDITFPDDITSRDKEVAAVYAQFLKIALACKKVKRVHVWSFADSQSFYNSSPQKTLARESRPLIYDSQLARKPAWYAICDAFGTAPIR
jgi:endo-1,4-beta-xylanase